jgi:hypothetical protein
MLGITLSLIIILSLTSNYKTRIISNIIILALLITYGGNYAIEASNYLFYIASIVIANIFSGEIIISIGLLIFGFSFSFGIWVRSLIIRIYSSLRHILTGVKNLPQNWHETLWILDLYHSPELIPGARQISKSLSISGRFSKIRRTRSKTNQAFNIILVIFWYVPAIAWRWSLKSSLWLWFPLALLLRSPFNGKSLGEVRDIAAIRINGLGKWLPSLAVVVILWLSSGYFSPEDIRSWAELGGDTISKLLDKLLTLTPPPPGLRHWALWLTCGLNIIMWWLSGRLQIMHKKVLEEEDALDGLTEERQNLFLQRAHHLERWHTARVVSFILLGYSFALYLASEWYPQELAQFIPTSLIGWL